MTPAYKPNVCRQYAEHFKSASLTSCSLLVWTICQQLADSLIGKTVQWLRVCKLEYVYHSFMHFHSTNHWIGGRCLPVIIHNGSKILIRIKQLVYSWNLDSSRYRYLLMIVKTLVTFRNGIIFMLVDMIFLLLYFEYL